MNNRFYAFKLPTSSTGANNAVSGALLHGTLPLSRRYVPVILPTALPRAVCSVQQSQLEIPPFGVSVPLVPSCSSNSIESLGRSFVDTTTKFSWNLLSASDTDPCRPSEFALPLLLGSTHSCNFVPFRFDSLGWVTGTPFLLCWSITGFLFQSCFSIQK